MNYYQLLPCNTFCHCESFNSSSWAWVGSVTNDHNLSTKLGLVACISYRISTDIHITIDYQVHYNCFNEPFAVSQNERLYWDMHGLIFETSIWLLAGSTRYRTMQRMCPEALHHTPSVANHITEESLTQFQYQSTLHFHNQLLHCAFNASTSSRWYPQCAMHTTYQPNHTQWVCIVITSSAVQPPTGSSPACARTACSYPPGRAPPI